MITKLKEIKQKQGNYKSGSRKDLNINAYTTFLTVEKRFP
jgi:hypothetical protein